MDDITKILYIDEADCGTDWPCRHIVHYELKEPKEPKEPKESKELDDELKKIKKIKMDSESIYLLCLSRGYKLPTHIKEAFENWMCETLVVHVRVMQRTNRKKTTICQGLPKYINFQKVLKAMHKNFNCGGTITDSKEYGKVIQLQGNHALNIKSLLLDAQLCRESNIHIHGDFT